jgi:hypothetical protein
LEGSLNEFLINIDPLKLFKILSVKEQFYLLLIQNGITIGVESQEGYFKEREYMW